VPSSPRRWAARRGGMGMRLKFLARALAPVVLVLASCYSQPAPPQAQISPPPNGPTYRIDGIYVTADGRFAPPLDVLIVAGVHGSCVPFPNDTQVSEAGAVSLPVGQVIVVYAGVPEPYVANQSPWEEPQSSDPSGLSPIAFCAHQQVSYSLPVIVQPFLAKKKGSYSIDLTANPAFQAFDPTSDPQLPPPGTITLPVMVR